MEKQPAFLTIGDTFSSRVVDNLTRTQIVQYAGASGDYNPVHTDEVYATRVVGYPSVFAQVWPGDTLDTIARVTGLSEENGVRLVDVELETTNQTGAVVMTGYGQARA